MESVGEDRHESLPVKIVLFETVALRFSLKTETPASLLSVRSLFWMVFLKTFGTNPRMPALSLPTTWFTLDGVALRRRKQSMMIVASPFSALA